MRSGVDVLEAAEHRVAVVDSKCKKQDLQIRAGTQERKNEEGCELSMQKVNDIPR